MSAYAHLLARAAARLKEGGAATPELDARLLLEAVSGLTRTDLLLRGEELADVSTIMVYESLLARRCAHEPVARILGQREFWGLPFILGPATLEPRPDSETLIELALRLYSSRQPPVRILDLGTGTGCLLAALLHEWSQSCGVAVDVSEQALATALQNFTALGLRERVQVHAGNWFEALPADADRFDLIISNPPYIPVASELQPEVGAHDPPAALFAGVDGLDAYRAILSGALAQLKHDGYVILELGYGQKAAVGALAEQNGMKIVEIQEDYGSVPRAMALVKK